MSELAKVLAVLAIEKLDSKDPIAQQAYAYHIDRLVSIARSLDERAVMEEIYVNLRAFELLYSRDQFTSERARALARTIDFDKLAREIEALTPRMVARVAVRALKLARTWMVK